MLEQKQSNQKNRFLLLLILLLFVATGVFSYLYLNPDKTNLISPIFKNTPPPDLSLELSTNLPSAPPLDYTKSTAVSGVNANIAYLSYNPVTRVVYSHQHHQKKISPASFTKLLTAVVALDITTGDPLLSASETSIDKEPTVLGLEAGEQLLLSDLIRASIATSANDAAATIAESVARIYGQPLPFFIDLMNQKAALIGMSSSSFINPEGYDDHNQYSTIEDISRLVSLVQESYTSILVDARSDMKDIEVTKTHGRYYLPNWNGLLGVYPGVDGLKIAYTEDAGYGTIVTASRDGIPVVLILSGAETLRDRDLIAAAILDHAYSQEGLKPAEVTKEQLDVRYKQWSDLAAKIRAELDSVK